jgi:hypothetical protein
MKGSFDGNGSSLACQCRSLQDLVFLVSITPIISRTSSGILFSRRCRQYLEDLILPTLSNAAEMIEIAFIRCEGRLLFMLPLFCSGASIDYDSVARDLLLSDICWDKQTTIKITKNNILFAEKDKKRLQI